MTSTTRFASLLLLAASIAACSAPVEQPLPGGGAKGPWTTPTCTSIAGTAGVTFTSDEGASLAPIVYAALSPGRTFVAALDTKDTLLASRGGKLFRSTDAGCTWSILGDVADGLRLVAAQEERAYGFTSPGANLVRIDGTKIITLQQPTADTLVGLGVDPNDGAHLRIGDEKGVLWESKDAGASWSKIGTTVPSVMPDVGLVYDYAFDPANLDHIVAGTSPGAYASEDGGSTWQTPTALGQGHTIIHSVEISPADGSVVWAQGMDPDDMTAPDGRTIWRSTDRGRTYVPVVKKTPEIFIPNQQLLAAHATNADVLYFFFKNDFYRYDQATGKVTTTNHTFDGISSVAFSKADASVVYLGLNKTMVNSAGPRPSSASQ